MTDIEIEKENIKPCATFTVSHYKHDNDNYSISLEVNDVMVWLTSSPRSYGYGCHNDIRIFNLSLQNIKELADALLGRYYFIKTMEENGREA